ncbi:hypothetical protein CAPTEDRAFT_125451 [Capitella teleta]|uniref:Guanylate kinase-like domain-containing protein n=1 Tax=Capitella teleta TaxID=283909 RepID=R7UF28_CAPTE|nr:hypothetical protein CAPTEDRAFT_125451 [Capitella teleta]|eukprot:ELU02393.1 hypothetical protein CAPTEDRAFT_125451 [Capitella teleta]
MNIHWSHNSCKFIQNFHCMLTIRPEALELLHKHNIYPITLFIKHKNARQIREVQDPRFLPEKMKNKSAKELFELHQDLEQKHKRLFSDVIPGDSLAYMFHHVKKAIDREQKKAVYVPSSLPL